MACCYWLGTGIVCWLLVHARVVFSLHQRVAWCCAQYMYVSCCIILCTCIDSLGANWCFHFVCDDALRRSMWPKGESVRRSRDGIKDSSRNLLNLYGIGQDVCLDLASLPHTYTSIKSTECVDLDFWMVTTVRAMLRCSTGGCNGMHFFAVALAALGFQHDGSFR